MGNAGHFRMRYLSLINTQIKYEAKLRYTTSRPSRRAHIKSRAVATTMTPSTASEMTGHIKIYVAKTKVPMIGSPLLIAH
jgi:hypothetical protein